jgi:hypothetical protein
VLIVWHHNFLVVLLIPVKILWRIKFLSTSPLVGLRIWSKRLAHPNRQTHAVALPELTDRTVLYEEPNEVLNTHNSADTRACQIVAISFMQWQLKHCVDCLRAKGTNALRFDHL